MTDLLQRLGQRIRELRTKRGLSQEAFADECGVHRTYMGHLERGEKNISFSSIVRVANGLDVTLSELFSGLEEGELMRQGGRRPNKGRTGTGLDRKRVLRELETLERALAGLKSLLVTDCEKKAHRKHGQA